MYFGKKTNGRVAIWWPRRGVSRPRPTAKVVPPRLQRCRGALRMPPGSFIPKSPTIRSDYSQFLKSLTTMMSNWIPTGNAKHRQIIKKYISINLKIKMITHIYTSSVYIYTSSHGVYRTARRIVLSESVPQAQAPSPPRNVGNSFHAVRRGN